MLQALAVTLVLSLPIRIFGMKLPEPVVPAVLTFAWAVIRPSFLAPFAILIMGLALDMLWGASLGLWAVSLLIGYGLALASRPMIAGQSRVMMWIWYAGLCAASFAVAYLASMLKTHVAPDAMAVFWQYLVTVALYPFADWLIEKFEDADVRFR